MRIAQKTYYALRALLELARRRGDGPISIAAIGHAEDIPPQFLQVIMRELRQGGFVDSRRGKDGGYLLSREPEGLSMGEVIRFLEGDVAPVDLQHDQHPVFRPTWLAAQDTINSLYDGVSFQELIDRDRQLQDNFLPDYVI
ncbi:MAG: Rrf2 family transcriptional regulator [Planctomycetota bacterium]|nr:MAG: Rrf2 family transcriptional regulator [Planctomycetota bacterium]